jgi:hypothetical protein
MKRSLKALMVIVFVATICFSFIACDNGTTSDTSNKVAGKTYQIVDKDIGVLAQISFSETLFTIVSTCSGSYTISADTISCTVTTLGSKNDFYKIGDVIIFIIINDNTIQSPYYTANGINTWTKVGS